MPSNEEIVRTVLERFARTGEIAVEAADPEVEWQTLIETYQGRDGLLRWQRELTETIGPVELEVHRIEAVGDLVVVDASLSGTSQSTGIAGEVRFGSIWHLREGKLLRLDSFGTYAEALTAARS